MFRIILLSALAALSVTRASLHATTVVVLWNPNEIVVAADSRGIWSDRSGDRFVNRCKIRWTNDFFYAIAGLGTETGSGFDVDRIVAQAARYPGQISRKVMEFEQLVKSPLARALASIRTSTPQLYQSEVVAKGGHALDVVFFGFQSGEPFLFARRFGSGDFSGENYQPTFPSSGHLILGEQDAIVAYIRSNPRWSEAGLVSAANRMIELQIAATPQTVGHPINILAVNRSGARWAFSPRGCPEITR
jgi:hypothetical protein